MVNANVGQGTIVFGVDPSGSVSGIEPGNLDKAQRTLSQAITDNFDQPLSPEIWTETVEGKPVIHISAKRLRTVPYHEYAGRAWTRQGSENRQLTLSEKDHLRKCRDRSNYPGPWKCDRCGAVVGQLISMKRTDEGIEKTYNCNCGGQFWPAT